MSKQRKTILIIIAVIFVSIVLFFNEIVQLVVNYQWLSEVGYEQVFIREITTRLLLGGISFVVSLFLYYLYFFFLKKSYYKNIGSYHIGVTEKRINQIVLLFSAALSFITAMTISSRLWLSYLTFINAQSFNIADPIFNNDISFYVFKLPFIKEVLGIAITLLFMLLATSFLLYLTLLTLRKPTLYETSENTGANTIRFKSSLFTDATRVAMKQLATVGFVFFIILAINYYLASFSLLHSQKGVVSGAGYTDIAIILNVYRIQMIFAVLGAIAFIVAYAKKNLKIAAVGPIALIVTSIIGALIVGGVQRFVVEPNEIAKEQPFIEHNIEFTLRAHGLDNVETIDFPAKEGTLNREVLLRNDATIRNIRINDYRPTLQAYNQLQAIRLYYRFTDVDIDRYKIDGELTQVFLSPREMDVERLSQPAQTWINRHLKYTHGFGIVLSQVNEITPEGQPKMKIRNIPPVSDIDIVIERPEIYFGELTNQYIIVNTGEKEFSYPLGGDNVERMFTGAAGIRLNGLNRLLYSYYKRTLKLMLSGSVTADSRIVFNRNIMERVNNIAPFIQYDEDPYIVINDGRLFWIIDGYTTSSLYPYSTPFVRGGVNYIRNSVKVVIDAYNGDTSFYIADENDPIIMTYNKVFPDLFQPLDNMKEGLRAHLRHPQDLFDIQAQVFRLYHMTNPRVFYNQEDVWYIAREMYYGSQQETESQYMVKKLVGEEEEEFTLSVAFTPKEINNLTAILIARNDGEHLGDLKLYRMPKDRNVYGPMQIEARIDSDAQISKSLTLWGEGGSTVIRGNLLAIPIEDSILYVEPIYIQASAENSIPEVQKIIVAYDGMIVMEDTLEIALEKIFGSKKPEIVVGPEEEQVEEEDAQNEEVAEEIADLTVSQLIEKASTIYDKATQAMAAGDWASYGKYIEELGKVLNALSVNEDN